MSKRQIEYDAMESLLLLLRDEDKDSVYQVEHVFSDCLDSFGMDRHMFFEFTGPRKTKLVKIYNDKIKCHLKEGEDFLGKMEKALSISMTEALRILLETVRNEESTDEQIADATRKYFYECFLDEEWDEEEEWDWDLFVKQHLLPKEQERVFKAMGIKV